MNTIRLRNLAAARSLTPSIQRCSSEQTQSTSGKPHQVSEAWKLMAEQNFPFARARLGTFVQDAPKLGNQYIEDSLLRSYLKRHVPKQVLAEIEPDLTQFGDRVATEMYELGLLCEQQKPYLVKYSAWGERVDRLITGPAWRKMHEIAAQEGLIAIAYERKHAEWSRLYGLVKNYLNCPSSGLYSCPLAMTDGAAKIVESLSSEAPWLKARCFAPAVQRPGQILDIRTVDDRETGRVRPGGTETVAVEQGDGTYRLYGYKWFSSATDADITFTLARVVDRHGHSVPGTKGLSLFYLEVKTESGSLNNIEMVRLKDKLGTRQLPTAELLLDGAVAHKVSDEGRGVPAISDMLKITRIHNSVAAAASMRRMVSLSRDYATRRTAFGQALRSYPLHVQTLARMEVEARGALILCLENMRLLGREDCGVASERDMSLLRILVPLSKLYSGKQALMVASEGLESFGGQGYIEDTGLPGILRDAQVLSIWEGTTNILSLDVLRAIAKSQGGVLSAFLADIQARMGTVRSAELAEAADKVLKSAHQVTQFVQETSNSPGTLELAARDLAFSLTRTYTGCLLVDHAASEVATQQDVSTAQRWCEKDLSLVVTNSNHGHYSNSSISRDLELVYDGYTDKSRL